MIIEEIDGAFEKISEVCSDDLEFIVAAANIAGYMEHAEQIIVNDDGALSLFCVWLVQKYYKETDIDVAFPEYAESELRKRFGIEC